MFNTSFTWNDFLFLLDGAWVTLQLTFWAILLGSFAGLLFGLLRALLTACDSGRVKYRPDPSKARSGDPVSSFFRLLA